MLSIDPVNTQAILIGASQFEEDEKLLPLPAVENNICELRRLITDPKVMGIPDGNVISILNPSSSHEILSQLRFIIPKAIDTLIFYYAGHGVDCPSTKLFYLATKTTDRSDPDGSDALSFDRIGKMIIKKAISSTKIIFILDCCYSGLAIDEFNTKGNRQVFIITATSFNETAKAPLGAIHTAFTGEFLHLLKKGRKKGKSTFTLREIQEYLEKQLSDKNFPKPKYVNYLGADKLKIAYNLAYPIARRKLEESLLKQALEKSQSEKCVWKKYLSKIDFKKSIAIFCEQFIQDKKQGDSAIFLMQETEFMREDLCLSEIKNILGKNATVEEIPVKIPFYASPDEFEVLNYLAKALGIKNKESQDLNEYASTIVEGIFSRLGNSGVAFLVLKDFYHLDSLENVLNWFVNEFWHFVEVKLSEKARDYHYIKFICIITTKKSIQYCHEKIVNLPLQNWKLTEIQTWLEREEIQKCLEHHSNLPKNIADHIYNVSKKGIPDLVSQHLQELFEI